VPQAELIKPAPKLGKLIVLITAHSMRPPPVIGVYAVLGSACANAMTAVQQEIKTQDTAFISSY
jgi:hypothetical protein